MQTKIEEDKGDCLEALKMAGGVERKHGESLYKTLRVHMNVVPRSTGNTNSGTRELTLKCKL